MSETRTDDTALSGDPAPSARPAERSHGDTAPARIQRKRSRGWKMPENAVYVGRPTPWGNPFVVGRRNPCGTITADSRHAASLYVGFAPLSETLIAAAVEHLRGRDLACWCALCDMHRETGKPLGSNCPYCAPCHADVLLKLANGDGCESGVASPNAQRQPGASAEDGQP